MPRIIADFNTLQVDPEKVFLGQLGTPNGDRLSGFHAGDRVVLDGGNLEVAATLQFDDQWQAWYAVPDWGTRRDVIVN